MKLREVSSLEVIDEKETYQNTDLCYNFENIFSENLGENIGGVSQTTAVFAKKYHNIGL
jgi:hypothetical protein